MRHGHTPRIAGTCWPAILFCGLLLAAAIGAAQETPTPFGTVVEVTRILTEVRVVDSDGMPVLGLGPENFRVKVDGQKVEVESVSWIPSTAAEAARSAEGSPRPENDSADRQKSEGRLIVFVFQKDIALRYSRTVGLAQIAPHAQEFIRSFGPDDRVAVLVFGSHLELRADFTADHEAVAEMVTTTEVLAGRIVPPDPDGPSLAAHLDSLDMKRAATMSRALELIGQALQPIEGTKSMIFIGFGLGQMSAGPRVTVGDQYRLAMEALTAARTSVFSIDITDADAHSLELGMRIVSEDTGGFYMKTNIFPEVAMTMLAKVISSYYELSIIPPPDLDESYKIKVKVDRPKTDVYVRQWHPSSYSF